MRMHKVALCSLFLLLPFAPAHAGVPTRDIPGSHDSPIMSRFPGSTIIGYQSSDYDQAMLPLGTKIRSGRTKLQQTETVAGKLTRIAYAVPNGKSAFEVMQNYRGALARAGFKTQFQCTNDACGDRFDFSNAIANGNMQDAMSDHTDAAYGNSMIDLLWCNGGDLYVATSQLARPQGDVDLSLLVCGNPGKRVGVLLQTVEEKPMTTGEVTVDAKAMSQGLAQSGHITLPGIHFATDSAALTPDSSVQVAQMIALLKSQPKLKVYIVGHTDNTGTLQHNLTLSQQRAGSVVKALEARGIAASRLAAKGLASYAPVASNHDDAGRARNRRVELVEQ